MSDNDYTWDIAPSALAKCKDTKCLRGDKKITKGELRLVKISANPFGSEVDRMRAYFHPECLFNALQRARDTTRRVSTTSDIDNYSAMSAAHKKHVAALIGQAARGKPLVGTGGGGGGGGGGGAAGAAGASSTKRKAPAPAAKAAPAPKKAKAKAKAPKAAAAAAAVDLSAFVIAITGTLSKPRKDIVADIESKGGRFAKSVTSAVTHLVTEHPYMTTKKLADARAKGVQVVGESFLASGRVAPVFDANSVVTPCEAGVKWQFLDNGNVWADYTRSAMDIVEAAYQDWQSDAFVDVRAVKSGMWIYEVDFNQMLQTNAQHEAHTQRQIRRVAA